MCVMSCVAPLFPPKKKPLVEMGSVKPFRNGYRACLQVDRDEVHVGPTRHSEAEALSDLAQMRGAASRAHVGSVAARLRAEVATQPDPGASQNVGVPASASVLP